MCVSVRGSQYPQCHRVYPHVSVVVSGTRHEFNNAKAMTLQDLQAIHLDGQFQQPRCIHTILSVPEGPKAVTSLSGAPPPPPRPHLFSIYSPEGISWPINLERFIISCGRHPCVGKCAALQPPLGAMLGQGCQVGAEILPGGNNLLAPPPPQGPSRTLLTSAGS